jgi:general secretion pathway protein F
VKAFEYTALDARGTRHRGTCDAETGAEVRQWLRTQALVPIDVAAIGESGPRAGRRIRGIGAAELALATRLLATLSRAGTPIDDALLAVSRQTEHRALQNVLLGVRTKVLEGYSLADGLAEYPSVFSPVYRSTIGAGEHTRHLDLVLERLADHTEESQQLRSRVRVALVYPAVLVATAISVVGALMTFVVPDIVNVFLHAKSELPWITRALIAVSDFVRDYGWMLLAAVAACIAAAHYALRRDSVRHAWQRTLLRAPTLGRLIREANAARFTRTLGILLGSGSSMLDALAIAAQSVTSLPMRAEADQALARVREGEALHRALGRGAHWPPLTVHLIANGEASGELEQMLATAAAAHERSLQATIAVLLGLLEPLLVFAMGAIVLVIVLAILLPIFELNRLV